MELSTCRLPYNTFIHQQPLLPQVKCFEIQRYFNYFLEFLEHVDSKEGQVSKVQCTTYFFGA